jgi:hypothetical protein
VHAVSQPPGLSQEGPGADMAMAGAPAASAPTVSAEHVPEHLGGESEDLMGALLHCLDVPPAAGVASKPDMAESAAGAGLAHGESADAGHISHGSAAVIQASSEVTLNSPGGSPRRGLRPGPGLPRAESASDGDAEWDMVEHVDSDEEAPPVKH